MRRSFAPSAIAALFSLGLLACGPSDTDDQNNNTGNTNQNNTNQNQNQNNANPVCGDSTLDPGEDCDPGSETATCNDDCTTHRCGDGKLNATAGEECDDGAANSDSNPDACRADCSDPECGDGVIDTDEECDDATANSDSVPDACRADCNDPACGDGVIDTGIGEECDDGGTQAGDGCDATCQDEGTGTTTAVLLIPDSSGGRVVMFNPQSGDLIGDFIASHAGFNTPINAVQGPDGNIYVSDQTASSVFRFDNEGTFVDVFLDSTDGLDNIRGIAFYGGDLYVTDGTAKQVLRFSSTGTALGAYTDDGSDPFDVLFYTDGRMLMADILDSSDNIRLYPAGAASSSSVYTVDFPEQINFTAGGNLLVAAFSAGTVVELDSSWAVVHTASVSDARGVWELGNGNWLVTSSGGGVTEVSPTTGAVLSTKVATGGWRFIEPADVDSSAIP